MAGFLLPQCSDEFNKNTKLMLPEKKTAIRHKIPRRYLISHGLRSTLVKAQPYLSTCSLFFCCQLVIELKFKPGWGVDSDNWPIAVRT